MALQAILNRVVLSLIAVRLSAASDVVESPFDVPEYRPAAMDGVEDDGETAWSISFRERCKEAP